MPVEFKQGTLENGLTVIAEIDPSAHTSALGFFVKTGARDEPSKQMGVSHFLEHMMFKGTSARTATDVDRDFDDIGSDHNAYTTSELTAFWAQCLPEHLGRAHEVLSDILRPSLREQDFDDEKKVIIEEIAMYQDHPFWALYERAMEAYYHEHPLSHRVLGTKQTVQGLARDEMLQYFQKRYSADNTVLALAGQLDFDEAMARTEEYCGQWQRTDAVRQHPSFTPNADDLTIESDKTTQHYLLMICPAPAMDDDRRFAAGMLSQILGDVEGSRLYWALVETGLAEEAQSQYDGRDGLGETLIYCSCPLEQAETVERIVLEQAEALVDSLTDDDLDRVRSRVATAVTLHGERPGGRMRRLGPLWTYAGEYRSLESELDRINAVTLEELRAVYEAFPFQPVVTARLTPA